MIMINANANADRPALSPARLPIPYPLAVEDDEETVALSMQIKTLLSKKVSLRAAASEAREMQ